MVHSEQEVPNMGDRTKKIDFLFSLGEGTRGNGVNYYFSYQPTRYRYKDGKYGYENKGERGEGDRKMYHYFHYYSVLFIGIIPNIRLFRAYTSSSSYGFNLLAGSDFSA